MREVIPAVKAKVLSVTCDRCRRTFTDIMELQECIHIGDTAGYGSNTFGDGTDWEVDLCQYCLHDLVGSFASVVHRLW